MYHNVAFAIALPVPCIVCHKSCTTTTITTTVKKTTSMAVASATYESTAPLRLQPIEAKCVRVYDGDTIWLAFEHAGEVIRCSTRLLGVDTAEIRTRDAQEKTAALGARDELRSLILGKMLRVRANATMDKYGRLLAEVWLLGARDDEPSINQKIMDRWGVPYSGGHKEHVEWCDFPRNGTVPL